MNWVTVDQEKCTGCGLCVMRCIRCFSDKDGEINANANVDNCNLCGHCVALCPVEAIAHKKMDMDNFTEYHECASIDTDIFIQFLRERRSHRHFEDRPISQEALDTLVDVCRYAPTGSNVQSVKLVITQDQEKIKKYSDLTIDYFMTLSEPSRERLQALEAEGKQDTEEYAIVKRTMERGELFDLARKAGMDPILYRAPAVMFFHSASLTSTPKDNCVIASTTVALTARTLGLEACYIGLIEFAANNYPPLQAKLGLPKDNKVFSVIVLGYPKLQFLRAVDRVPITVRWE
jgi:nitroreductase/NAD-dependent dihydropyrimidine dehydrogenase PreA subunit